MLQKVIWFLQFFLLLAESLGLRIRNAETILPKMWSICFLTEAGDDKNLFRFQALIFELYLAGLYSVSKLLADGNLQEGKNFFYD